MNKILNFFKTNLIIVKWTIGYFFTLWFILKFIFNFDMFSKYYWWKFFHATLHGFGGFVFGFLMYAMIPIYLASVMIIYRKKEPIITIPLPKKTKKTEEEEEKQPEEEKPEPEKLYPDELPAELRVPFMRAKNHLSLSGAVSVYNKKPDVFQPNTPQQIMDETKDNIPLPSDFDSAFNNFDTHSDNNIPTFTEINFDEPVIEQKLENNTTKYLESKNIEYETYKQYVATQKYLIYEHNDEDFWIMDEDTWFATGKQIDSPINELKEIAKQNDIIPVLYLHSKNIMDIESTIEKFENLGIHVIKSLEELN